MSCHALRHHSRCVPLSSAIRCVPIQSLCVPSIKVSSCSRPCSIHSLTVSESVNSFFFLPVVTIPPFLSLGLKLNATSLLITRCKPRYLLPPSSRDRWESRFAFSDLTLYTRRGSRCRKHTRSTAINSDKHIFLCLFIVELPVLSVNFSFFFKVSC